MPFLSKFGSRWRPKTVAPRVYQDDAAAVEVKEQSFERVTSSKSESAAHWQPALAPILEDSKRARSPVKQAGEKKKTSSRRGRCMTKSHGRDGYWRSSTTLVMPFFAPTPFMF